MCRYFVARIEIHDPEEYKKYLTQAGSIFKKYKGEYLVVDDEPETLEGDNSNFRLVIIKFQNDKDFREWYFSEEYRDILIYRLKAARCNTVIAKGIR